MCTDLIIMIADKPPAVINIIILLLPQYLRIIVSSLKTKGVILIFVIIFIILVFVSCFQHHCLGVKTWHYFSPCSIKYDNTQTCVQLVMLIFKNIITSDNNSNIIILYSTSTKITLQNTKA